MRSVLIFAEKLASSEDARFFDSLLTCWGNSATPLQTESNRQHKQDHVVSIPSINSGQLKSLQLGIQIRIGPVESEVRNSNSIGLQHV
jgi:hypothetical protein